MVNHVSSAKTIGKRIRKIRRDKDLSQMQVATRCRFGRSYLSQIESGVANPTLSVLCSIATALNVDMAVLFVSEPGVK